MSGPAREKALSLLADHRAGRARIHIRLVVVDAMQGALATAAASLQQQSEMMVEASNKAQAEVGAKLGELGEVFNGTVAKIRDLIDLVGQTVVEVERQAELKAAG